MPLPTHAAFLLNPAPRSHLATEALRWHLDGMASRTVFSVFLASSGDVQAERDRVPDVVERVNRIVSGEGFLLDLYRFESHAVPGLHEDGPQGLINPKLDEADIVVLLMWNRVGPGTAEELQRTLTRWEARRTPVLLPYLCTRPARLDTEAALADRKNVLATQALLESRGILARYDSPDELARELEMHLVETARALSSQG